MPGRILRACASSDERAAAVEQEKKKDGREGEGEEEKAI
jgi:hypothetical protein|tara:strand:+ start:248 stop:364 length:117 start_codon:yes stop_codon:yes gene_type:complete